MATDDDGVTKSFFKRHRFGIGLFTGIVTVAIVSAVGAALSPWSMQFRIGRYDYRKILPIPKPKESPVTIRGGSMIVHARFNTWDEIVSHKHYSVDVPEEFLNYIYVEGENFGPEILNQVDPQGKTYAWKIIVNRRGNGRHGLMLCSDLLAVPVDGEPCVRGGDLVNRSKSTVHLFVLDPAINTGPNIDFFETAAVHDDDGVGAPRTHRLSFRGDRNSDKDHIQLKDGIEVQGLQGAKFKCLNGACQISLVDSNL